MSKLDAWFHEHVQPLDRSNFTNQSASVVIMAYDRLPFVALILDKLHVQRHVDLEVILVDDGSRPPLIKQLGSRRSFVSIYMWLPRSGYRKVRNINAAFRVASRDKVIVLDDDVIPASNYWAAALIRHWNLNKECIIHGHTMIFSLNSEKDDPTISLAQFPGPGGNSAFSKFDPLSIGPLYFVTFNTLFEKSAWARIGGMDIAYDGFYGYEDIDMGNRVKKLNVCEKLCTYDCLTYHLGVYHLSKNNMSGGIGALRNHAVYLKKWGKRFKN